MTPKLRRPWAAALLVWITAVLVFLAVDRLLGGALAQALGTASVWFYAAFGLASEMTYGAAAVASWRVVYGQWIIRVAWQWPLFLWSLAGGAGLGGLLSAASRLYRAPFGDPWPSDAGDLTPSVTGRPSALILLLVVLVLIAPVMEEWLFRGVFQTSLEAAAGPWAAMAVTAVIFALAHELDASNPALQPWLWTTILPLAAGLGVIRLKTRSMSGNIGLHLGYNLWAAVLIVWPLVR